MAQKKEKKKSPSKTRAKKGLGETPKKDKPTTIGLVGSAILPIAGGIAYLKQKDDYPRAAKAYGIAGLASFALGVLVTILSPKTPQ